MMFYLVMCLQRFADIEGYVGPLPAAMAEPAEEPYRFIPVFETKEAAEAWAEGKYVVVEVQEVAA